MAPAPPRPRTATNLRKFLTQKGEILKKPLPPREQELYTFETRGSTAEGNEDVMAASRQVDLLEPIDLAELCQIAGISKMQLDYWTNKAQIPTKGKKQRIYDIDALETVMLIKQAKDKGLNLGAAIDAARRFREQPPSAEAVE
jgi:MerR-like DNA binding protein